MKIGMIGLGKMGANMVTRLMNAGHELVVYDVNDSAVSEMASHGAIGVDSLQGMITKLPFPRIVWLMVPAGKITLDTIEKLANLMTKGDIIIDGGNSNYKDSMQHAQMVEKKGIEFLDVGTSGGIWGLTEGYSLMIGGKPGIVEIVRPIFETLAPGKTEGWGHVGPGGSGHFTKMIHNGIEYGLMQAYAEGFEIMQAKKDFNLDLAQIAHIWQKGSVVRSWLLDLTANALDIDAGLSDIKGWVADSGEGRWTVAEAIDLDVPAPVITLALQARFVSRQNESFAAKILAAMRNQFGGHAVKKAD
ncbi:MAG: decarboxylating 6-phosphogluconate dehydrogenase [Chloroflexota bacterium]